jgi:hypothetical protein
MKQRRTLLLLLLAIAGSPIQLIAQAAAIQIQIYDYTGLPSESVQAISRLTQQILAEEKLSTQTTTCPTTGRTYCGGESGYRRQVVVHIVGNAPTTVSRVVRPTLAQAFAGPEGGAYAAVYLERVRHAAAETDVPMITILAYATVHEVGHLLLGPDAHTAQGMMNGHWGRAEFAAMNQHRLHFSKQQIHQMEERSMGRTADPKALAAQR